MGSPAAPVLFLALVNLVAEPLMIIILEGSQVLGSSRLRPLVHLKAPILPTIRELENLGCIWLEFMALVLKTCFEVIKMALLLERVQREIPTIWPPPPPTRKYSVEWRRTLQRQYHLPPLRRMMHLQ